MRTKQYSKSFRLMLQLVLKANLERRTVSQTLRVKDRCLKELPSNLDLQISHLKWSLHLQLLTVVVRSQLLKWVGIHHIAITKMTGIEIKDHKATIHQDRVEVKDMLVKIRIKCHYLHKIVDLVECTQGLFTQLKCHLRVDPHPLLVMGPVWTCSKFSKIIWIKIQISNNWTKALKPTGPIKLIRVDRDHL